MSKEEIIKSYNKERTRIKRLITFYENRGFNFDNANILPAIPKKITEGSIRNLQKITKETIKSKGTFSPKETSKTTTHSTQTKHKSQKKYRPKATSEKQAKETIEKHYKSGKRKKGKGKTPEAATEGIATLYDEMSNKPYSTFTESDPKWYGENESAYLTEQDENYLTFLQQQVSAINNWTPKTVWSTNFQEAKASHRSQLISIFKQAIQRLGKLQVARNISNHMAELTEMVNKILYAGSGRDAVRMFDEIHNDLKRLPSILEDRALSIEESQPYTDAMETEEIFDYFDEV